MGYHPSFIVKILFDKLESHTKFYHSQIFYFMNLAHKIIKHSPQ